MAKGLSVRKKVYDILIVDDHPIVRRGLAQLISQDEDLRVCGEASNAQNALDFLKRKLPDLLIVDISLEEGVDGIELIKMVKARYSDLPMLVVSMHDEALFAERSLKAGARGYIMKQVAIEGMMEAIRRVLGGEVYVSERVSATIVKRFIDGKQEDTASPMSVLSDRELEVFRLLGRGYSTREIADQLHVSVKTVESYRAHIKEKLGFKNATELLTHAVQWVNNQ